MRCTFLTRQSCRAILRVAVRRWGSLEGNYVRRLCRVCCIHRNGLADGRHARVQPRTLQDVHYATRRLWFGVVSVQLSVICFWCACSPCCLPCRVGLTTPQHSALPQRKLASIRKREPRHRPILIEQTVQVWSWHCSWRGWVCLQLSVQARQAII